MITTSDFKKGTKILYDKEPYLVIGFTHVKPGKGGAFVRTKMKNLITGLVREETFRSGEKFPDPGLEYKEMQYLYQDGDMYHFMDTRTYDEIELNKKQIKDILEYLKEETTYTLLYFNDAPITVTPPLFLELKVVETPPGVRGDTAQGAAYKPATLETGLIVQVPLFVNEEDIIKVDTRTGEYIERI